MGVSWKSFGFGSHDIQLLRLPLRLVFVPVFGRNLIENFLAIRRVSTERWELLEGLLEVGREVSLTEFAERFHELYAEVHIVGTGDELGADVGTVI